MSSMIKQNELMTDWKLELIKFYESDSLDALMKSMCKDKRDSDDLKQELILYLLDLDEVKIKAIVERKQLLFYSYGYLRNQYHSSNSEFFRTYRNFVSYDFELSDFEPEADHSEVLNLLDRVECILNNEVDFFSSFLFRQYYFDWFNGEKSKTIKGKSYRKIEQEYSLSKDFKIDHMFIYNSVRGTMLIVKEKLKKEGLI